MFGWLYRKIRNYIFLSYHKPERPSNRGKALWDDNFEAEYWLNCQKSDRTSLYMRGTVYELEYAYKHKDDSSEEGTDVQ